MKHVYPPRHPDWLDDASKGQAAMPSGDAPRRDEAGTGQPPPVPRRRETRDDAANGDRRANGPRR